MKRSISFLRDRPNKSLPTTTSNFTYKSVEKLTRKSFWGKKYTTLVQSTKTEFQRLNEI